MTLRNLRLLLHTQHPELPIQLNNPRTLQLLNTLLPMTHNTTRPPPKRKPHKLPQTKLQNIIRRHNQQIIINLKPLHRKQNITNSPQPRLIRLRPIVYDRNGFADFRECVSGNCATLPLLSPFPEHRSKPMISHNNNLIYLRNRINIIHHPPQNSIITYLQQRLRKVPGKLPQTRSVPGSKNYTLHNDTPSALSQTNTSYFPLISGKALKYSSETLSLTDSSNAGSISAMQQPLKPAPLNLPP